MKLSEAGGFLRTSGDGRLWVKFDSFPYQSPNSVYVCAFDPTQEVLAGNGETFLLTPDGIRRAAE